MEDSGLKNKIIAWIIAVFALFLLPPCGLCAETNAKYDAVAVQELKAATAPQAGEEATGLAYENNVGFMKDVPRDLREALPVCDEFLDVKWIREMPGGYWVGRVIVDVSTGEKKGQRELVVLEKDRIPGRLLIFDITTSSHRGRQFDELIMAAEIVRDFYGTPDSDILKKGLAVVKDRKQIVVCDGFIGSQSYLENGLIAPKLIHANTKICIAHPEKTKWLIKKK